MVPADDRTGFVSQLIHIQVEETHRCYSTFSLSDRVAYTFTPIAFSNSTFFQVISALENNEQRGLYVVGTVRGSIEVLPDILKGRDRMQRKEFMFRTKGCVAPIIRQDNKPLSVLSTYHSPKQVTSMKRKKRDGASSINPCPAAVAKSNTIKGAVDRFDQRRLRYAILRRSIKL